MWGDERYAAIVKPRVYRQRIKQKVSRSLRGEAVYRWECDCGSRGFYGPNRALSVEMAAHHAETHA